MPYPRKHISIAPKTPAAKPLPPVHKKRSNSPEAKKPKAKRTKAVVHRSKVHQSKLLTGIVTALRADGSVNIRINGNRFQGVPTQESYDIRSIGDKVTVMKTGAQYMVMGKVGSDDLAAVPNVLPTTYLQYSFGINKGVDDRRLYIELMDGGYRVGRKSEQFPVSEFDIMAQLAIGYYSTSNAMNSYSNAHPTYQIDFMAERSEWDDGYEGPASFTLFAIKNDALPESPSSLSYQTTLNPASIDFTLEPGELKIITLPDTWRNNIAATLSSASIRGFVIQPAGTSMSPEDISRYSYGMLTPLTGTLRIADSSA